MSDGSGIVTIGLRIEQRTVEQRAVEQRTVEQVTSQRGEIVEIDLAVESIFIGAVGDPDGGPPRFAAPRRSLR